MRVRFGFVICASVAAMAAAPAAASACPSLVGLKAFSGHASTGFEADATGPYEPGQPQYGTETIHLQRSAHLDIALTHKKVTRRGVVIFTGKAKGGNVLIDDTFDDSSGRHSGYHFDDPLSTALPDFGSAELFLDSKTCKYLLTVVFAVSAIHSGVASGSSAVEGTVYGHREHIPGSRKLGSLNGAPEYPDAYHTCPGDPLQSGKACYQFFGGFTTDFMTLFKCHSAQAVNCSSSEGPVGNGAAFAWHLKPSYFKKKT